MFSESGLFSGSPGNGSFGREAERLFLQGTMLLPNYNAQGSLQGKPRQRKLVFLRSRCVWTSAQVRCSSRSSTFPRNGCCSRRKKQSFLSIKVLYLEFWRDFIPFKIWEITGGFLGPWRSWVMCESSLASGWPRASSNRKCCRVWLST